MALAKRKQPICAKCKSRFSTKRENAKKCPKCIEAAKQPRECKASDCISEPEKGKQFCINCKMNDFWNNLFGKWLLNLYSRNFSHIEQIPEDKFMIYEYYKIYRLRNEYSGIYFAYDRENMSKIEVEELEESLLNIQRLKSLISGNTSIEIESIMQKLPSAKTFKSVELQLCHLIPSSHKGLINIPENLYIAPVEINQKLGKKDFINQYVNGLQLSDWGTCKNFYEKPAIELSNAELKKILEKRLAIKEFQRTYKLNAYKSIKKKEYRVNEFTSSEIQYKAKAIHALECKRLGIPEKIRIDGKLINTDAEMVLTGKINIQALKAYEPNTTLKRELDHTDDGKLTGYQILYEDDKCADNALTGVQQALKDSGQIF
ncbi:hypothetical protein [Thalassotalea castellviae]|uniref:HNH endonuclease n=1 Tax=Thalassotalea castellviae TaxID=3075612 RepID=A0ABU2ZYR5_9GAMM|nr:hypothetical protein [Thalassotalea sp. W431]MDT0602023.1 hypothetical protein [Thalassotalea sp. W431]